MELVRRIALLAGGLFVAGVAVPSGAHGAVQCSFGGTSGPGAGFVGVALDAPGDSVTLEVAGGEILANGVPCATPSLLPERATVRNTDVVVVRDTSGGPAEVRIADPAAFGPGVANEGDGSAEIEFDVDLGAGPGDVLRVEAAGADAVDRFEAGTFNGVPAANLNARAEDRNSEDVDLGFAGVERLAGDGRALDDKIDAAGGAPFGGPLAVETELFGADGADALTGGTEVDVLHGGPGEDVLAGGEGRDVLLGDGEEDVLDGGPGRDRLDGGGDDDLADYRALPAAGGEGVVARLAGGLVGGAAAGDRLVSVEGLLGSPLPDVVTGSDALNYIDGGGGDDRLDGAGETDALVGSAGRDRLVGGGARDVIFGGPGADEVQGGLGKDIVVGGAGNDRIETEKGVDVVDVSGAGADVVDCGPGRDGFDADRHDRLRACEVRLVIDG
jgi:Ca2+-binding RTX toxin-like protein